MYAQEIACPWCGQLTAVNVADADGVHRTPCSKCHTQIGIETDQGKVVRIFPMVWDKDSRRYREYKGKGRGSSPGSHGYLIRIDLLNARRADFECLENKLLSEGFLKTIEGENGDQHQLPRGTYRFEHRTKSLQQAFDTAIEAAKETGKDYQLIAVDYSAGWFSLCKVKS